MPRLIAALAALLALAPVSPAAPALRLLPAEVALDGPHARQRLLVVMDDGGLVTADRTRDARFSSSNPGIAAVNEAGLLAPVADGEAEITALVDGQKAVARVKVARARDDSPPSFPNDVIPMLTRAGCNSGACHGALAGKGGLKLSLRGYNPVADHFALTRQAGGRRLDPRQPARSLLLQKPTTALAHGGGLKLDPDGADYRLLADWVAAGGPGPRPDDPRVERLEVLPARAVLRPKDRLHVLVRAWYSDGRARDVTPWARFASTEELVAACDADGLVRVTGHGETAVTAGYANLVAVARVTSPYPHEVPADAFTRAPRVNFIDDHVLAKLAVLRLPPSSPCGDDEFIRRLYLDAAGILPTPEEVRRFLADTAPDRRARLVDHVLARPEFVDAWAYRLADLFLVSSRKLPGPAVWAFHQYLRQAVADNTPWDRVARDVLTASGSSHDPGPAAYFLLHKDTADLTEATAVTFLGMSVTCARCHNHPLEKWTQDQYWALANLFSRVALKNGDRPGEVTVQSLPYGDVPHPRTGAPVPPAPLDGKPLSLEAPADRRAAFADWLVAPDNPFFARAFVNRVWRVYTGRGLVEPDDDLRQTNPPTNEDLLGALVRDFTTHGHDVRRLMRTILTSATYGRSSRPLPQNAADDRFYSHALVRRLPAEVILDAYAHVTGVPTNFNEVSLGVTGGTRATTEFPVGTRALQLPDSLVVSPFLDSFGRPERVQACSCERQQDSSVGQALHLNNGRTLNDKLRAKGSRLEAWLAETVPDDEAVRRLYLLALCRPPSDAEAKRLTGLLAEAAAAGTPRREALEDLFWAVLTARDFLFNR